MKHSPCIHVPTLSYVFSLISRKIGTFLIPFNLKSHAWWDCNLGQLHCWGLVGELVSNLLPVMLHVLLHHTSGVERGRSGELLTDKLQ